ncbi:hypothetical protein TD95_003360 [Thielaviopsis punctulata]|uniref:Uncharacterized protein n=1 Tax=Thielaviopsis punctulata TaxID=72032 RepID=A0A0F4ZJ90_9PEZI|nr:hypothetical protein TD95_003360 [Thielaviopsis punctulata]
MPEGSSRSRRGAWGFWVPLTMTVAVATLGVAAWVISQRDSEEEVEAGLDYEEIDDRGFGSRKERDPPGVKSHDAPSSQPRTPHEAQRDVNVMAAEENNGASWGSRVSGVMARASSPQQFFGSAGKSIATGMAAASAAVNSALHSIREEDKAVFQDHETWSEEADAKHLRDNVVIVVSADFPHVSLDDQAFHEQASILSHIPKNHDFNKTKLYVLIYAPCLKEKDAFNDTVETGPPSSGSSFSNIGHDQAQPSEAGSPLINVSSSYAVYNSIYSQALALVENSAMIIRYTTPNGHMHALRQLNPDVIYMQESLCGDKGSYITQLQSWYRYNVIVVVGTENGHGGIADSECEADREPKVDKPKWWQDNERVARGKGIIVVDGTRLQDDWLRRLE